MFIGAVDNKDESFIALAALGFASETKGTHVLHRARSLLSGENADVVDFLFADSFGIDKI